MTQRIDKNGLQVDERLARNLDDRAIPGSGVSAEDFCAGFAKLITDMAPKNIALLDHRDVIQAQIDDWHIRHRNQPHDHEGYKAFLREIGYLIEEGPAFEIETANVDPEIA